jgi:glutaredoxin
VKEFLSRAGRTFTVRNVDEDGDAYDELLALGFRTVPVTVVGARSVKGFDPEALMEAILESA